MRRNCENINNQKKKMEIYKELLENKLKNINKVLCKIKLNDSFAKL